MYLQKPGYRSNVKVSRGQIYLFWVLQAIIFQNRQTVGGAQYLCISYLLGIVGHGDYATNAVTSPHVAKGLVDLVEGLSVSDEFVDLELARHVVVDELGELSATLDTTECASLPYTASDELESCVIC